MIIEHENKKDIINIFSPETIDNFGTFTIARRNLLDTLTERYELEENKLKQPIQRRKQKVTDNKMKPISTATRALNKSPKCKTSRPTPPERTQSQWSRCKPSPLCGDINYDSVSRPINQRQIFRITPQTSTQISEIGSSKKDIPIVEDDDNHILKKRKIL